MGNFLWMKLDSSRAPVWVGGGRGLQTTSADHNLPKHACYADDVLPTVFYRRRFTDDSYWRCFTDGVLPTIFTDDVLPTAFYRRLLLTVFYRRCFTHGVLPTIFYRRRFTDGVLPTNVSGGSVHEPSPPDYDPGLLLVGAALSMAWRQGAVLHSKQYIYIVHVSGLALGRR